MRIILALCSLLLALMAPAAPARAHASLVESSPAEGQVLRSAPTVARLRFNEPVSPLLVRLFDGTGQVRSGVTVRAANETVEIALPAGLGEGSHVLSYRVISADGHPVGGSLTFAIGHATAAPRPAPAEGDPWIAGLLWAARVVMYVGLFGGAGGAFFLEWMAPAVPLQAVRRLVRAGIALGFAAAVLSIGYQGLDVLAASLRSYWTRTVWAAGLGTSFGPTSVVAAASLLVAYAGLRGPSGARRALALLGVIGVGLALSLSGHASTASPQWLTRPAVFIHAVCIAYWIGALVPLAALLHDSTAPVGPVVRTWSSGAVIAVSALVVTGAILTFVQVPTYAALLETAYGRILLLKLAAVAALLGLAAINRFRLTPALGGPGLAERRLARSIRTELMLALAIFGLVGLWRFTPPPRAIVPAPASSTSVHMHSDRAIAEVVFQPRPPGLTRATITLRTPDNRPLDAKDVRLLLANRAAGVEPIERVAARIGDDLWRTDELVLPAAGRWQVSVEILVSDFEKVMLEDEIELTP